MLVLSGRARLKHAHNFGLKGKKITIDDWKKLNLEEKLVLGDSLHWLDQVRGDGVCKAMPLLDFLLIQRQN